LKKWSPEKSWIKHPKVAINDKISIDFINEVLFEYEFKRVDFITEPGEFSVRGGIVDVFIFK
jgi:transcription-repair coupling factor (superfamily II helicase)